MKKQKVEFSARASLVARGVRFQQMGIWAEVSAQVKIRQKAHKHTPLEKLLDCLINILACPSPKPDSSAFSTTSLVFLPTKIFEIKIQS